MSKRSVMQVAGVLGLIAISLLVVYGAIDKTYAALSSQRVDLDSYYLEAQTNDEGRFKIEHGLDLAIYQGHHKEIVGVMASIQNQTGIWYTIEAREGKRDFTAWNDTKVYGQINLEGWYNQPVENHYIHARDE